MSRPTVSKQGTANITSFDEMLSAVPKQPPKPRKLTPRDMKILSLEEKARERGYQEGYELGHKEGLQLGATKAHQDFMAAKHDELQRFMSDIQRATERINAAIQEWYQQAEEQSIPLIMEIAKRVVMEELKIDRSSIVQIAKDAFKEVSSATHAKVRMNPDDLQTFQEHKQEIMALAVNLKDLDIVEDPKILGGCVIETESGLIDASIDGKLDSLSDDTGLAA